MIIREVEEPDYKQLVELLNEAFNTNTEINFDRFERHIGIPHHHVFVGIVDDKIVATYTILLEYKLIHNYGMVAHGEDLAVKKEYRNKGLARKMMEYAIEFCKKRKVYKLVTTCSEENVDYFNKCLGTRVYEISLRRDF